MQETKKRLIILGLAPEVAEALVNNGFDTPKKIKEAADKDLEKVLPKAKVTTLRKRYPSVRDK